MCELESSSVIIRSSQRLINIMTFAELYSSCVVQLISQMQKFLSTYRRISSPYIFTTMATKRTTFSEADQEKRFSHAKEMKNERYLNIDSVYRPEWLAGKTVLVTGGNRGLGYAITEELLAQGAKVFTTTRKEPKEGEISNGISVISGIELQDNQCGKCLVDSLKAILPEGQTIDVLINSAGYFYRPVESVVENTLNFEEELKMIDICAIAPLRITNALYQAKLLVAGSKVVIITSQGGSVSWRETQNPSGGDYGHHMSKAAGNMMSRLLSLELRHEGITVGILHPGFNKTDMTEKYTEIWDREGAVDPKIGAKRVLHEILCMQLETTGSFVNCEDGLVIPW